MRNRFFLTIFIVLLVVTTGSIVIHSFFLKEERLRLIDQQVRETATALLDSELGDPKKINLEKTEEVISEELGETRIGKFFVIRNAQDKILFESSSAKLLPLVEIPRDQQWITLQTGGKFIRVLNLQLPRIPDRTLQVGLVLENDLVNPDYFSQSSGIFIAVVLALGFIASFVLTSFLLQPIAKLGGFISGVLEKSQLNPLLPKVPEALLKSKLPSFGKADEFQQMVSGLNALIDKVNKSHELSRLWAYQMAHELKTPLSILSLEIEKLQRNASLNPADAESLRTEMKKISETVSSFLGWAELENSVQQKHLFANRASHTLRSLEKRLKSKEPERLKLRIEDDFMVLANPHHLEQLLSNLISNALSYSPQNTNVEVICTKHEVKVVDRGPGIPDTVLSRIGEPFNKGSKQGEHRGHGLGLAWVSSVSRLYDWDLKIKTSPNGTTTTVRFHDNSQIET